MSMEGLKKREEHIETLKEERKKHNLTSIKIPEIKKNEKEQFQLLTTRTTPNLKINIKDVNSANTTLHNIPLMPITSRSRIKELIVSNQNPFFKKRPIYEDSKLILLG